MCYIEPKPKCVILNERPKCVILNQRRKSVILKQRTLEPKGDFRIILAEGKIDISELRK